MASIYPSSTTYADSLGFGPGAPVREPIQYGTTPPSAAASGSTLNGTSWLSNLLQTAIPAYVAVETVRAETRRPDGVTTQAPPRVESAGVLGSGISTQTILIGGAVLLAALIAIRLATK